MKLALEVTSPTGGSFRPQDSVRGSLQIRDVEFQKPPQISISLTGQVLVDTQAKPFGANPGTTSDTIFNIKKELSTPNLVVSRHDNTQLVYSCPLTIEFPANPFTDSKSRVSQLPSSVAITTPEFAIRSEYVLTVTVKRYVLGKVPKSTTVRRILPFVSNPMSIPQSPSPSPLSLALYHPFLGAGASALQQQSPNLPSYAERGPAIAPRIHAQVLLPQPAVLVCGRDTPVGLEIHTPTALLGQQGVFLRSITIKLLETVSAAVGSTAHKAAAQLHSCHTTCVRRIGEERFQPDLGIMANLSLYKALPSCISRRLRIEHTVEVEVGVSFGADSAVQMLRSCIDVTVVDSPPAYQPNSAFIDNVGSLHKAQVNARPVTSPVGTRV